MLSTNSSRTSSSADQAAIAKVVADRAGHDWCLFLDRDGVINRQIVGDYVRNWRQFEWLPRAVAALRSLSDWAPHIVVVTNQQGIGKKLMTAAQVSDIHAGIAAQLAPSDAVIEAFKVCPHLVAEACGCRKPEPSMVLDWLGANRHVDPALSVVVGDSATDIELAYNVAAATGGCSSVQIGVQDSRHTPDASFDSLWEFATAVERVRKGLYSCP